MKRRENRKALLRRKSHLSNQRPAEFTFSRHVEHKMSQIKAGNSNTTEIAAAE